MTSDADTAAVCIYCDQSLVRDDRGYKDATGLYQCQSKHGVLGGDVGFHVPAEREADENGCECCGRDVDAILSWGGNIRPRKEKLCGKHAEERRKGLLQIGEQVTVILQRNDGLTES